MQALEKEITRLQGKLPQTNRELEKTGKSSAKAAVGIKSVGTAIKTTLGPLIAATAAIGGLVKGFQTIAGQDFAAAKVRSLGVDSEALVANLKAVSAELNGNASVAELTAAAYDVASAGFTDAADAAMVLKAASLGAVGGFSDINTVGDAATSVLNAYGKSARDAGKLVDGFIQTQNDGKIVVDQYARNIGKVASAAAGLKIPIEEVNAVIAQSTAAGNQAEVSFTGLKAALARLASGEATKALKGVGLEINAATLEADGLLGTFRKIRDAGLDTGQLFKAFGTEAGPALLPVLQNLEKFEELLKNQENAAGAAQRAQQQAANTINGAWNRVRVAFENLFSDQAALAQAIIPILDAVAQAINGITFALEQWKKIAGEVKGVMDELGATLNQISTVFGDLGNAIGFAADQLGKLLFRADGMEQFQALGRDRFRRPDKDGFGGMASFGPNYKEQEAALFAAASGSGTPPKPQQTRVPAFNPSTSGGGSSVGAELDAAAQLEKQLKRNLEILKAENDLDKELLQNKFKLADQLERINEIEDAGRRAALTALAQAGADLENKKAIEAFGRSELEQAQALIDSTYQQIEADARRQELIEQGINPALADSLVAIEQQFEPVKKILDEKILTLETTIEQLKTEGKVTEELEKQLDLIKQKRQEVEGAEGDAKGNAKGNEDPGKIQQYMDQLEADLNDTEGMVVKMAQTVESELGNAMASAITGIIDGTKTAQEAFADMFKNIGEAFIKMATEMIAKALIMKALGILTGGAGGGGGGFGVPVKTSGIKFFEGGGYTGNAPRTGGVDGKGGFPAILHPQETVVDHTKSMDRWNGGNSEGTTGNANTPINVNYRGPTLNFNGDDYIPRSEAANLIKAGAEGGERRVYANLRNSRSRRSTLGI